MVVMVSIWKIKKLWLYLCITIVAILSIVLPFYFISVANEENKIKTLFSSNSDIISSGISKDITCFKNVLLSLSYAFGSHGSFTNITKSIFNYITTQTEPGSIAFTISYDPVIYNDSRLLFENFFSNQHNETILISNIAPNGTQITSPDRDIYVPIGYTNFATTALGIDLLPIPNRKPFIENALYNRTCSVSNPLIFLGSNESIEVLLVFCPAINIYNNEVSAVVAYVLFIDNFFGNKVASTQDLNLNTHIFLSDTLLYSNVNYSNTVNMDIIKQKSNLIYLDHIQLFDQYITIIITDNPKFENSIRNNDKTIGLVIGIILLVLMLILVIYTTYRESVAKNRALNLMKATAEQTYQRVLSYVCHEIKNPLNTIISAIYLAESKLNQLPNNGNIKVSDVLNDTNTITDSAFHIKNITDQVLEVGKLLEGKITVNLKQFNVIDLCVSIIKQMATNCSSKINFKLNIDDMTNKYPIINSDPNLILQILTNGLSNAIKFTKHGTISIVLCQYLHETEYYQSFEIINKGIGLKNVNVKLLFVPFTQGVRIGLHKESEDVFLNDGITETENEIKQTKIMKQITTYLTSTIYQIDGQYNIDAKTPPEHGNGLGLPISRMLSKVLGGYLTLEDDYDITRYHAIIKSSDMIINIQPNSICVDKTQNDIIIEMTSINKLSPDNELSPNNKLSPKDEIKYDPSNIHILVIDDSEINVSVSCQIFKKLGFQVDGLVNVKYLNYSECNKYNVILLDILMDKYNGIDVARNLIKHKYSGFIIALTGNVSVFDIETYKETGFNGVIAKPYKIANLKDYIYEIVTTGKWNCLL
jgi:signal transduction histidine kinase/CheY-like chemotaxis protein